ncbi:hypothetical protein [Brucella intermedia]|uniref:hypothetical protein n=1 Tax=Brucella intermedia TaxID=94625 RepID=UPI0023608A2F|nr:hypothetical protein [Brucella intermedia]
MKIWTICADTVQNGSIEEVAYTEEAANARCAAIFAPIWKKHRGNEAPPADWRAGYDLIYDRLEDWISLTVHDISDHPALAIASDTLTDAQQGRALLQLKNAAIAARIQGAWDHPALLAFMQVLGGHADTTDDILTITRAYLHPEAIAQAHRAWDESSEAPNDEDALLGA